MSEEVLIKVEGLGKKFCKDLKKSLKYGVQDVARSLVGKSSKQDLRKGEFWALKGISFELKRGECLGLIGHNGAGKSTLLKVLNGLIKPDEGKVMMRGKICALIELGAGFNPVLTGRENIYNNASVLGFTKKEIDQKLEAIIDFSEIRDSIDAPVQSYSSGMKVRLGFAVAAQLEPDVLIIDEVLAVGDIGFRVKCMNRIQELLQNSAVIFVSHAMTQVSTICTSIMLMDRGEMSYFGNDLGLGIQQYLFKFNTGEKQVISESNIKLDSFEILGDEIEEGLVKLNSGELLKIKLKLKIDTSIKNIKVRLGIFNIEYRLVAEVDTDETGEFYSNTTGEVEVEVEVAGLFLRYGKYSIHLHVTDADKKEKILRHSNVADFIVKPTISIGADFLLPSKWSGKNINS